VDEPEKKIEFASSTLIEQRREKVNVILRALGRYMGWKDDLSLVFVSDESTINDFGLKANDLAAMGKDLGITVEPQDLICELAARLERQ
jgi:hypothetical protein